MMKIESIPTGAKNAVSAKELAKLYGCEVRVITRQINGLRCAGQIICSSTEKPQGYYRPETVEDVKRFVRSMDSRRREIARATEPARRFIGDGTE